MRRIAFTLVVVFLAVSAVTAQAQQTGAASLQSVPVASRTQAACPGMIANPDLPHNLFVVGGADDDFHSVVRQFVKGDSIFISPRRGEEISVGGEYRVVRPAKVLFHTSHYQGQLADVRKLGRAYEDVAEVRVTHVNSEGVVAKVTFSCGPIVSGDMLVPFQPRAIPEYTISKPLDHFAPLDKDKQHGRIIASNDNHGFVGRDSWVYLDLGEPQGILPGQRFRIFKDLSHNPQEIIGEAVVVSVQSLTCVAMVISSYREIAAGDYVEQE